jgi:hypothetical protein
MTNKVEDPAFAGDEQKITLTKNDLAELIGKIADQQAEQQKALVEAIIKSREPYVSPVVDENNRRIRAAMKKQREQLEANRLLDQQSCEHIQGSNSQSDFKSPYGLTAIIKHYLDSGEVIGICTNCTRVWRQGDPDYNLFMRKKSGNQPSASGRRTFTDPAKAIRLGQGKKE